jgi:hypothetical protein
VPVLEFVTLPFTTELVHVTVDTELPLEFVAVNVALFPGVRLASTVPVNSLPWPEPQASPTPDLEHTFAFAEADATTTAIIANAATTTRLTTFTTRLTTFTYLIAILLGSRGPRAPARTLCTTSETDKQKHLSMKL